jgi:signal recognition particle subunit SRP54
MLTLIEKAQANFDEDEALKLEKKVRQATFDLEDFLGQLQQLKKMGSIGQVMDMIPGMSSIKKRLPTGDIDDDQIVKIEAVIHSMTPYERSRPQTIGGSRRRRIAKGSGTTAQDVNQLLNQFNQTRKLMQKMSTGKGLKDITRMFQ